MCRGIARPRMFNLGFMNNLLRGVFLGGIACGAHNKATLIISLGLPLHQLDRSPHLFTV